MSPQAMMALLGPHSPETGSTRPRLDQHPLCSQLRKLQPCQPSTLAFVSLFQKTPKFLSVPGRQTGTSFSVLPHVAMLTKALLLPVLLLTSLMGVLGGGLSLAVGHPSQGFCSKPLAAKPHAVQGTGAQDVTGDWKADMEMRGTVDILCHFSATFVGAVQGETKEKMAL